MDVCRIWQLSNLHSSLPIVRLQDIPGPFRRPATTLGCLASTLGLLHMGLIGPERAPQVYATLMQLYDLLFWLHPTTRIQNKSRGLPMQQY